eukprot:CAMPEP_0194554556 /NCGR_PEP_ID=MMETSP0253-20130528/97795_1 /TAXON_ID=2966 /ORGANISM="Noctiluca scintillans" /LENGTH=138 /DNA_ID=CAMNT_0039402047 /DNA_START=932 /DNA_END=1345 /DNA_ORIENTATION=-
MCADGVGLADHSHLASVRNPDVEGARNHDETEVEQHVGGLGIIREAETAALRNATARKIANLISHDDDQTHHESPEEVWLHSIVAGVAHVVSHVRHIAENGVTPRDDDHDTNAFHHSLATGSEILCVGETLPLHSVRF